jgi:hypothetical protein
VFARLKSLLVASMRPYDSKHYSYNSHCYSLQALPIIKIRILRIAIIVWVEAVIGLYFLLGLGDIAKVFSTESLFAEIGKNIPYS